MSESALLSKLPVIVEMPAGMPTFRHAADALESTAWNLGEMVVVRDTGPQRCTDRTGAMTRSDQMDHYQLLVSFARDGTVVVVDDTRVRLGSGAVLMLDLGRPARIEYGAGTVIQVFLPRETLDEVLSQPRDLHALALAGASATVLAEHLRSLTTCLPEMTASQAPHAVTATLHMIAASLASTPAPERAARVRHEAPLLRQACRYIELHLGEPELSATDVCDALNVARATLYRVFKAYGGISNHIRERRLARIHDVIVDGRDLRALARIAEEHGFENPAHFSRAFRQQYGRCASDVAGSAAVLPASAAVVVTAEVVAGWLRALRG